MPTFAQIQVSLLGRKAISPYPFPGSPGAEVGIKLLSDAEMDAVRQQAARYCEEKRINLIIDPEFMDRALMRYTLLAACFDLDKGGKFFQSHEQLMELDNPVVQQLYALYSTHQESLDPLTYKSEEEVAEFIEALGKAQTPLAALSLLDSSTLRRLSLSMAWILREKQLPAR